MLKRSVIASNITNLTDARYFAARGADYLLYDLSEITLNEIMAITEWVEGVKTLVKLSEDNVHLIEELILRVDPFAIGGDSDEVFERILIYAQNRQVFYNFPAQSNENAKVIISNAENIDPITYQISTQFEVLTFYAIHPTVESLNSFINDTKNVGVILEGSSEIETGLKSFENLDEILDLLEI